MRILANSSHGRFGGQLACYSAVLKNGNSFGQPAVVGSILGVFAFVAFVSSVAATVYGDDVAAMRTHYAHSPSVLVVFAVFQHIFFTGALSVNWPSVLPAFWSNYAWSGGMISSQSIQDSIRHFVGSASGSPSKVGAAASGTNQELGGYNPKSIYPRSLQASGYSLEELVRRIYEPRAPHELEMLLGDQTYEAEPLSLAKRDLGNRTNGFSWYGDAVPDGVPLPGNYSGFAGTLSVEEIPASTAFLTGLIWFLIILVAVVASLAILKGVIELLVRSKRLRKARIGYFRQHWLKYCIGVALRTCYIGFFALTFLAMFQFTYDSAAGPTAIAAIVFLIIFVGLFALAGIACYRRLKWGGWISEPDRIRFEQQRLLKVIPTFIPVPAHRIQPDDGKKYVGSVPFWRVSRMKAADEVSVHDDVTYIQTFGWLNARFRRTRWWYFAAWLAYDFIRACFLGGASGQPLVQVFGLLVVEVVACGALFYFKPFEGQRMNALVVYALSFSKIITVALSAAFDVSFNLERIPTTGIGIVIIVIQGILTILLLIAIALGAVSTWFSVTRDRSDEDFRPKVWLNYRNKYLAHIEQAALDVPPPPKPEPVTVVEPQIPKGPYFSVNAVKRAPKVEDEDEDMQDDLYGEKGTYYFTTERVLTDADLTPSPDEQRDEILVADDRSRRRASRALSMQSTQSQNSLPFGARAHRASWTRDTAMNYSSMDPAEFSGPPVPVPAIPRRYSDMNILDEAEASPSRPRLGSRASLGAASMPYRYSSYSQGAGETPPPHKRMSLGTQPSYESFQMERSHPDYIASLNQAFGGKSVDRPKSTGDLLEQLTSPGQDAPARPLSVRSAGAARPVPAHGRTLSGGSSVGSQTPPQSPTILTTSSPGKAMNRRSANRLSMPASPVLHPHEEGVD